MQATLSNTFHNTQVSVEIMGELPYRLTKDQTAKVKHALCGRKGCTCGVVRGPAFDSLRRKLEVLPDAYMDGSGSTWSICSVVA